ncbi:MAG TPA: EAL domain-containing protein [Aquabacterium sp.]|nr:EAL domain-containing protein [Aquabacterium sp.]
MTTLWGAEDQALRWSPRCSCDALAELQQFRLAVEHTHNLVVITDAQRRIQYVNPAYTAVTGWTLEEAQGRKAGALLHGPLTDQAIVRQLAVTLAQGEPVEGVELVNYNRQGQPYWVRLDIRPVRDADGHITHYVSIQANVTAQRQAHEALRASERRLAEAQRLARMASFESDLQGGARVWSPGAEGILGVSPDQLPLDFAAHLAGVHPEDQSTLQQAFDTLQHERRPYELDYRWRDPASGGWRWIRERCYHLPAEAGLPERLCGLVFDISATKDAHDRIHFLAWHDTLTGLANREQLKAILRMEMEAAQVAGQQMALLFVDLDRFKTINDSLGHQVGDELLRACALRLRETVRAHDVVGRLGGDEFVIVLPGLDDEAVVGRIVAKLLDRLAEPLSLDGRELHVTASVGISLYPRDGDSVTELMRHADVAMYQAKARGRNTHCFFSQELTARSAARFELESQLRLALVRREFSLHFQPQFRGDTGALIGFEALLRWQTPSGEWVPPDQFIPVAEESGLIQDIGDWVLAEACAQWRRWQAPGRRPLRVAVNISAWQLRDRGLPERIQRLVAEHGLPPDALELELTETVAMHDPAASIALMRELRERGVSLAVDDFGTGYSSLAYLKTLPIQRIKLDRTFVKDMDLNPDDKAICRAAIQMARSLGLEVVAEGVETEAQRAYLADQGCDLMQGYHLGRPLPADQVGALLARHGFPLH